MSKHDLKNKVVLLTGAGSGIGRCLANEFALHGAKLILTDINKSALQETVKLYQLEADTLGLIEANFLVETDIERTVQEALVLSKRIDVFYANAGFMILGQFTNLLWEDFEKLRKINLDAPIKLCQKIVPHMITQGGGYIGFTASASAMSTPPGATAYGMTKAGLCAYAEALGAELHRHNISVTSICPGFVKTPLANNATYRDKRTQERTTKVPAFIGSSPEKVARLSVKALLNKKIFLIIGFDEKVKYFLKNNCAPLYKAMTRGMAKLLLDDKETLPK
jgi:short-subunit dehydrogenase